MSRLWHTTTHDTHWKVEQYSAEAESAIQISWVGRSTTCWKAHIVSKHFLCCSFHIKISFYTWYAFDSYPKLLTASIPMHARFCAKNNFSACIPFWGAWLGRLDDLAMFWLNAFPRNLPLLPTPEKAAPYSPILILRFPPFLFWKPRI